MGTKGIIPGLKRSKMKVLKLNKNIGFDGFEKNDYPEIYIGIHDDAIIMEFDCEK